MPERIRLRQAENVVAAPDDSTLTLARKMRESVPTPTDYTEKLFLDIAVDQGLLVAEAEMITLDREKQGKGDKRSTVPDFLLKEKIDDAGIYVEVTENNARDAHKNRQRKVMVEAGLGSRYVQLVAAELEEIQRTGARLIEYMKKKIEEQDSPTL